MRHISCQYTVRQIVDRSKDVTRRLGWKNLRAGELLQVCEKCQGLGKGGKVKKLAVIRVRSVRREHLVALIGGAYTARMAKRETIREGFPHLSARQFVKMFCEHMHCDPFAEVSRIEFEYVEKL